MKFVHLSSGFMLTSIVGFFIAAFFVLRISDTWGFLFMLFFMMMFVSSLISMTYAPESKDVDEDLKIYEHKNK